jgi:FkbM family methyltransferase
MGHSLSVASATSGGAAPRFPRPPAMPRIASLLAAAQRARLRGSTRATFTLARWMRSLQAVPIVVNDHQTMFVDLRNGLAHVLLEGSPWQGVPWEVKEQIVMRHVVRPGDVVHDVGANIGLHTALLAELVGPSGHVHAFEPNGDLLYALRHTAEFAGNVTVHPYGLGEEAGRRTFYIPADDLSMASFADWTEGRVGEVHAAACELRVCDDLIRSGEVRRPRFIKCDVEGGETLVFSGAREALNVADGPIVLYEANGRSAKAFGFPIDAATTVLRGLANARFRIFHVRRNGALIELPAFRADCDHYNLLAVPESRVDEVRALITDSAVT